MPDSNALEFRYTGQMIIKSKIPDLSWGGTDLCHDTVAEESQDADRRFAENVVLQVLSCKADLFVLQYYKYRKER